MNSENNQEVSHHARSVLSQHFFCVLSTQSVKFPGYPFGSVVPYCFDYQGRPLILISRLAQHTRNIIENPKLSMVILERTEGNVQTDARITLLAQAIKLSDDLVADGAARYYRFFPAAQGYHTDLDFEFYYLAIETMRFIPGFGQARWLSPGQVLLPNPFSREQEERIVTHMNEDHGDALLHYHQSAPIHEKETRSINPEHVEMVAIDAEGIVLRVNDGLERIAFSRPVHNPGEARQILVEMASD